jgi:hypothetical protein
VRRGVADGRCVAQRGAAADARRSAAVVAMGDILESIKARPTAGPVVVSRRPTATGAVGVRLRVPATA